MRLITLASRRFTSAKKNIVYISVANLILNDLRLWSILYIKKAVGFSTYVATWRHKRQHQNPITYRLECPTSYLTDLLHCDIRVPLYIRAKTLTHQLQIDHDFVIQFSQF